MYTYLPYLPCVCNSSQCNARSLVSESVSASLFIFSSVFPVTRPESMQEVWSVYLYLHLYFYIFICIPCYPPAVNVRSLVSEPQFASSGFNASQALMHSNCSQFTLMHCGVFDAQALMRCAMYTDNCAPFNALY